MSVFAQKQPLVQTTSFGWMSNRRRKSTGNQVPLIISSLKAGHWGGLGLILLLGAGLLPLPPSLPAVTLPVLIVTGYVLVCLLSGVLSGFLAGDRLKSDLQSVQVAWMAGYWSGIISTVFAMLLAAKGMLMADLGQGIGTQLAPDQLALWSPYLTPAMLALIGRVAGALIVYGLIGSLLSALIAAISGMVYFGLFRANLPPKQLT